MEFIYKTSFTVCWALFFGLCFMIYFYVRKRKDLININNFSGFMFSAISILGGIKIFYSQFLKDYTLSTEFKMDTFYTYYGGIVVVWISYVAIKSRLSLEYYLFFLLSLTKKLLC